MEIGRDYVTSFGPNSYDGDRVKGEYRGVFSFNRQLAIVAGADWEKNSAENTFDPVRHEVDVTSPYAQVIVEPFDGLVLTGGGRIDNHSMFGAYDTHRLTAAYLLPQSETKFHASYGTGFRAPSLYELYDPFSGNPNFRPETSESWDAGVDQEFMRGTFGIGATYFVLDTTDLITFNSFTFAYEQTPGLTKSNGVELSAFAKLTKTTLLTAAYTYTDTEEPDGTRVARVPRHNFVVGVNAQPIDKLSVNITGQYVADTLDATGFPLVDVPVDNYFLLSAKIGYEVLPGAIAYVRGENLLDENYVTTVNYNTPGLTVFGGVQFALPAN
jgi:vitamin B12 transporter